MSIGLYNDLPYLAPEHVDTAVVRHHRVLLVYKYNVREDVIKIKSNRAILC